MGKYDTMAQTGVAPSRTVAPLGTSSGVAGKYDALASAAIEQQSAAERRAQIRRDQPVWENLADDVKELPTNLLRAGEAYGEAAVEDIGKSGEAFKSGGVTGLLKKNASTLTDSVLPTIGTLAKANVESLAHTVRHPVDSMHDEPLVALGNIASLGTVGGAVGSAAKNAGRIGKLAAAENVATEVAKAILPIPLPSVKRSPTDLVERLRPSKLPSAAARQVSKVNPALAAWLLDPTATISPGALEALREVQDMEPVAQSRIVEALKQSLAGLTDEQRVKVRDLLAAEDARVALPDLPARVQRMQAHLRKPEGALPEPSPNELVVRPYTDDSYIQDFAQVENALKRRPVTFVDKKTGEDLGGMKAMLGEKPLDIDPANIDIKINQNHPLAATAEELKPRLLGIRQTLAQLAKDANSVNVGDVTRGGKVLTNQKLLPDAAFMRHLATYMPDVQKGEETGGLANQLREVADTLPSTSASPFSAAHLKHEVPFAERVERGATTDVDYALTAAASAAVHETMKYKLFDTIANNRWEKLTGKVEAMDADRFDKLLKAGEVRQADWVRASTDADDATGLPKFGALAGKYVSKPVYLYLTNVNHFVEDAGVTTRGIFKGMRRFRNAFASSKVIGNIPSHVNNLIGNVMHQMVDGGLLGVGDYGRELGKSVARGFTGTKQGDKFYQAAASIGLVSSRTVKELDDVVGTTMRRDGFWAGIKAGVDDAVAAAARVKASPGNAAKAAGVGAVKAATSPLKTSLKTYEYIARDNALMRGMARLFSGVENANRLSIFRRAVEDAAREARITVDQALADENILHAAKQRVERYAYRYDDVPLALQVADQHGFALFSRYAWKSVFGLLDAVTVDNPGLFRTAQNASDMAYDKSSERDRKLLDHQPPFAKGRVVPLGKHKTLSMTYWTPYSTVPEMVGVKPKGTYDSGYFRAANVFDPMSGPLESTLQIIQGTDPQTGKPIEDRPGRAIESGHAASFFDLLTPGSMYHLTEKLGPAAKAAVTGGVATDKRGRELTVGDAVMQNLGIRTEQRRDGKVEAGVMRAYAARVNEIIRNYNNALRKERDPVKRTQIAKEREAELAALHDQLRKILR